MINPELTTDEHYEELEKISAAIEEHLNCRFFISSKSRDFLDDIKERIDMLSDSIYVSNIPTNE